ncbi:hypothetical protein EDB86DRAFT_3102599 [Lactarius hatsudake]|nr:hypothetical protein EDB86DRAFT_3102599 [Lactarius hatsudake]
MARLKRNSQFHKRESARGSVGHIVIREGVPVGAELLKSKLSDGHVPRQVFKPVPVHGFPRVMCIHSYAINIAFPPITSYIHTLFLSPSFSLAHPSFVKPTSPTPNTSQTVPRHPCRHLTTTSTLSLSLTQLPKTQICRLQDSLVIAFATASSHHLHTSRHASAQPVAPVAPTLNLSLTHVYAGHPVVADLPLLRAEHLRRNLNTTTPAPARTAPRP